jgi:hypothetical protein
MTDEGIEFNLFGRSWTIFQFDLRYYMLGIYACCTVPPISSQSLYKSDLDLLLALAI